MKPQPTVTVECTLVNDCQKDNRVPPATKNHKVLLVSIIRPQNKTINTLSLSGGDVNSWPAVRTINMATIGEIYTTDTRVGSNYEILIVGKLYTRCQIFITEMQTPGYFTPINGSKKLADIFQRNWEDI